MSGDLRMVEWRLNKMRRSQEKYSVLQVEEWVTSSTVKLDKNKNDARHVQFFWGKKPKTYCIFLSCCSSVERLWGFLEGQDQMNRHAVSLPVNIQYRFVFLCLGTASVCVHGYVLIIVFGFHTAKASRLEIDRRFCCNLCVQNVRIAVLVLCRPRLSHSPVCHRWQKLGN